MATQTVDSARPVLVPADAYGWQTVENLGPDSVYYKADSTVSSVQKDGTLAPGATLTLTTSTAFVALASSALLSIGRPTAAVGSSAGFTSVSAFPSTGGDDSQALQAAINQAQAGSGTGHVLIDKNLPNCLTAVTYNRNAPIIVDGAGDATQVTFPNDLGAGTYAISPTGSGGGRARFRAFNLHGHANASVGTQPTLMDGLWCDTNHDAEQMTISGFNRGLVVSGNHNSFRRVISKSNFVNCQYGPCPDGTSGNQDFDNCDFAGAGLASFHIERSRSLGGATFKQVHFGFAPYGLWRDPTVANWGQTPIGGCLFTGSSFESCGNEAISFHLPNGILSTDGSVSSHLNMIDKGGVNFKQTNIVNYGDTNYRQTTSLTGISGFGSTTMTMPADAEVVSPRVDNWLVDDQLFGHPITQPAQGIVMASVVTSFDMGDIFTIWADLQAGTLLFQPYQGINQALNFWWGDDAPVMRWRYRGNPYFEGAVYNNGGSNNFAAGSLVGHTANAGKVGPTVTTSFRMVGATPLTAGLLSTPLLVTNYGRADILTDGTTVTAHGFKPSTTTGGQCTDCLGMTDAAGLGLVRANITKSAANSVSNAPNGTSMAVCVITPKI